MLFSRSITYKIFHEVFYLLAPHDKTQVRYSKLFFPFFARIRGDFKRFSSLLLVLLLSCTGRRRERRHAFRTNKSTRKRSVYEKKDFNLSKKSMTRKKPCHFLPSFQGLLHAKACNIFVSLLFYQGILSTSRFPPQIITPTFLKKRAKKIYFHFYKFSN